MELPLAVTSDLCWFSVSSLFFFFFLWPLNPSNCEYLHSGKLKFHFLLYTERMKLFLKELYVPNILIPLWFPHESAVLPECCGNWVKVLTILEKW